jgi:hypothetical protein
VKTTTNNGSVKKLPIRLRIAGEVHALSVTDAMRHARDLNKQIDAHFAKERVVQAANGDSAAFHRMVGDNIKAQRAVLGLKAGWVAKRAGLSSSFFSDVENGKRGISSENLVAIASACGCTIEDLVRIG